MNRLDRFLRIRYVRVEIVDFAGGHVGNEQCAIGAHGYVFEEGSNRECSDCSVWEEGGYVGVMD